MFKVKGQGQPRLFLYGDKIDDYFLIAETVATIIPMHCY